jgi:hypothetical protein
MENHQKCNLYFLLGICSFPGFSGSTLRAEDKKNSPEKATALVLTNKLRAVLLISLNRYSLNRNYNLYSLFEFLGIFALVT